MKNIIRSRGFIQIVILAVVTIAALAYFNIDLRAIFEKPIPQKILSIFITAWTAYLQPMIAYLYTSIRDVFPQ